MTFPLSSDGIGQGGPFDSDALLRLFARVFGYPPTVVARAPGRVNLVGEHTDYNDGFVLPMAVQQCTWAAAAPRTDGLARAVSAPLNAEYQWTAAGWDRSRAPAWTAYIAGVADLLRRRGLPIGGFDMLVCGDIPMGAGLSSSAALEVSAAVALLGLTGRTIEPVELADLCRDAEHQYAGVPCGIMDQYISILGRHGAALLIDCRSRAYEYIPLNLGEHVVLIVDSGVHHELTAGGYADRRRECQAAADYFHAVNPAWKSLRDVPLAAVQEHEKSITAVLAARALHVCGENERTLQAADALRAGDLHRTGKLMAESHWSLRDNFEVSCAELDLLVDLVSASPGVLGARMTGGGFGGSIVAIAHRSALNAISAALREHYDAVGKAKSRMIVNLPAGGASLEYTA